MSRPGLRPLALVGAFAAAFVGAVAPPAGSAVSPRVTANVRVTPDPNPVRADELPSVLVDPHDPRRVYVSEVDVLARRCLLHASVDGGATFATAPGDPLPQGFQFCTPPSSARGAPLAWAPDGSLLMALNGLNPGADVFSGPTSPILARSRDGGRTWSAAVVRDNRARPPVQASYGPVVESAWMMSVATDAKANRVYLGWGQRGVVVPSLYKGDPIMRPVVATSDDGGRSFGPPVEATATLPEPAAVTDFWRDDALAVAPDGTLFDLFPESPPGLVAPVKPNLDLARSTDGGRSFTLTSLGPRSPFTDWTQLAAGPTVSGRGYGLVAVYEDFDPADPAHVQHVFERHSTDRGQTWSPPRRLDDEPLTQAVSQYMPAVSIAPDGRIDAAWYDMRNDDGRFLSDVYYTSSFDGGASWGPNLRVSDTSSDRHFGTFANVRGPVGLASSDAAAYLAWSDTRRATVTQPLSDIYFADVVHGRVTRPGSTAAAAALGAAAGLVVAAVAFLLASARLGRGGLLRRADGPRRAP